MSKPSLKKVLKKRKIWKDYRKKMNLKRNHPATPGKFSFITFPKGKKYICSKDTKKKTTEKTTTPTLKKKSEKVDLAKS